MYIIDIINAAKIPMKVGFWRGKVKGQIEEWLHSEGPTVSSFQQTQQTCGCSAIPLCACSSGISHSTSRFRGKVKRPGDGFGHCAHDPTAKTAHKARETRIRSHTFNGARNNTGKPTDDA